MEAFWFIAVALVFAIYIVLDGFDLGTGMIYLWVSRTDQERRIALRAIGPVWNGNEVWLLAGGGLLFFAFPKAYASGFSGFYLALILVLWLLMLRGLSIELRSHIDHPIWKPVWDITFSISSLLLAIILGVTIGNVLRGVPLTEGGYFFTPLWTTFSPGADPGILDYYTVFTGVSVAMILSVHGAQYLAMKTEGDLYRRATRFATTGGWLILPFVIVNMVTCSSVQPLLSHNYSVYPIGYLLPVATLGALSGMLYFRRAANDVAAFGASCLFILLGLGSMGWAYFPNLLISTTNHHFNLTIYNSATSDYGLTTGLVWFSFGFPLVLAYTVYVYRSFWGKVHLTLTNDNH